MRLFEGLRRVLVAGNRPLRVAGNRLVDPLDPFRWIEPAVPPLDHPSGFQGQCTSVRLACALPTCDSRTPSATTTELVTSNDVGMGNLGRLREVTDAGWLIGRHGIGLYPGPALVVVGRRPLPGRWPGVAPGVVSRASAAAASSAGSPGGRRPRRLGSGLLNFLASLSDCRKHPRPTLPIPPACVDYSGTGRQASGGSR